MRTVTRASTAWPVRLITLPRTVFAPELTDPTVTPGEASAGPAASPIATSVTPPIFRPCIDTPSADQTRLPPSQGGGRDSKHRAWRPLNAIGITGKAPRAATAAA